MIVNVKPRVQMTLLALLGCACISTTAQLRAQAPTQQTSVDRVVAVIDNEPLLLSDIQNQVNYLIQSGRREDPSLLRCQVFEQMLTDKLLLAKAKQDSIEVSDDRVESELDRRIQYYTTQAGGVKELEKVYKKSVIEIKVDLRNDIRNQLLVQEQRSKINDGIKATPREVAEFFGKIPKDSLPLLPAEVEIAHILIKAKPSKDSRDATRKKLREIRQQIISGELSFEQCARFYGQDGTAKQDGDLGEFGRGMMASAFEEQAYLLSDGQVSDVFETEFGFHIVRLDKRLGDRLRARHILLIPEVTAADEELVRKKLNDLRTRIFKDTLRFDKAAAEFSEDPNSKDNGGLIMLEQNEYRIPLDQLESDLYFKIDQMKVGDISEALEYQQQGQRGAKAFHIVKLIDRLPPHKASLQDDYQKFHNATVQGKQSAELIKWFRRARQQVYIEIKDQTCAQALQNWYE
jgi:peptidyl-prolyl cis-trans isomerase SurA